MKLINRGGLKYSIKILEFTFFFYISCHIGTLLIYRIFEII